MKRKDALTDAVEALQENKDQKPQEGLRQVVNEDGEFVTLGTQGRHKPAHSNKKKPSELSPRIRRAIEEEVAAAVRESFNDLKNGVVAAIKEAFKAVFDELRKKKDN